MNFWECELSIKILTLIGIFFLCLLIINDLVIDSVPMVYDHNGNVIVSIGMAKDEVISNMGKPRDGYEAQLLDESCVCYPVSSQDKIVTSWRREVLFSNYLKIIFDKGKVEEIYFFGHFAHKGEPCKVFPLLAIKVAHKAYR